MTQLILDQYSFKCTSVHLTGEKLIIITPIPLSLVHRGVSMRDQRLTVGSIFREHADADAGGHLNFV
ncbi:MAG: hypothetical protein M3P47_06485, partial [Pseudomonadota bacterium]|nr:hypothetical protein [Pseudomonadota bacterium]